MPGQKNGFTYYRNVLTPPLSSEIRAGHRALYTMEDGVFAMDHMGVKVRLDDYQLIQNVSGALYNSIISQSTILYQGNENIPIGQYIIPISHNIVNTNQTFPIVTLNAPSSDSVIYPLTVTSRSVSGFNVVLAGAPDVSGYSIYWLMGMGGMTDTTSSGPSLVGTPLSVSFGPTSLSNVSNVIFTGSSIQSLSTDGSGGAIVSINASGSGNSSSVYSGEKYLSTGISNYTINIGTSLPTPIPVISVKSDSIFYLYRISNITNTTFDVTLNTSPSSGSNDSILWHVVDNGSIYVLGDEFGNIFVDEFGNNII